MDYATDIAKAGLKINAIKLRPNDPFTWASGFRMPIYNDNRMFLADYSNRMMVANGFKKLIEESGTPYHLIAGTSTAGIAPAASVASLLRVPLVITEGGKPYAFIAAHTRTDDEFDAVASTCPWSIPFGVNLANERQVPFMYVRQSQKSHGLKQQIEGIPKPGQRVILLDFHMGDSYLENARTALTEKGVDIVSVISESISQDIQPEKTLEGLVVPMIEDLISTGGSSAEAVQGIRDNHGTCNHCFSVFNYGLNKSLEAFASLDPHCDVRSLLTYDKLLEVAKETGYINPEESKMLAEWRADPFNWGENHGFPKVEK